MAKNDLEYRLRMEIKRQMASVTQANSPNIFAAIHKPDGSLDVKGYSRIEASLVDKIIAGQLAPAAAIPQLEQELELM